MSIESARAAIAGVAINVHIPDLDHPSVVCDFDGVVAYLYPFELEVVTH